MKAGFNWPALMRAGLHGLGLAPAVFWALTPAELQIMLGSKPGNGPMLSEGLAALMAAYPDKIKDQNDER
ncbi:rcc01693 family protein [Sulfitobacter sp.]|uniref:rcc01693 family protein n=1 Tax=Sulfitobacter sp. TaxID=1903071 RepID=UPI0030437F1A